jgi:hypothetical protein
MLADNLQRERPEAYGQPAALRRSSISKDSHTHVRTRGPGRTCINGHGPAAISRSILVPSGAGLSLDVQSPSSIGTTITPVATIVVYIRSPRSEGLGW